MIIRKKILMGFEGIRVTWALKMIGARVVRVKVG